MSETLADETGTSGADSSVTSTANGSPYDLERLDRAIESLVVSNRRLRAERDTLRADLDAKAEQERVLEGKLLDANQRRQDVAKRIDELISQIDELDAQLEAPGAKASAS